MEETHFGPIWFIPGENHGRYPFCHSIYIEGAGVVIDPSSERGRLAQLKEDPGVKEVWLSHWHEDHFKNLDLFDDLPLKISESDAPPLSDIERFIDSYGIYDESRDYWRRFFSEQFQFRPRRPAQFLKGGEVVDLGSVRLKIISTPGHTPGHLSFFFREVEALFLGDYDLSRFGPWYGDVQSSIEETIGSVNRLRRIPSRIWLTPHEQGVFEEDPGEAWDQYLDVIAKREERLLALLEEPRTMEAIVEAWIIYGKPREPKLFYEFGERANMKKHLERLMVQGVVAMEGESYYRL